MSRRKTEKVQTAPRAPKTEPVTMRLPVPLVQKLKRKAAAERRTVSNWLMLRVEKILGNEDE